MKTRSFSIFWFAICAVMLFISGKSDAEVGLWQITKGNSTSYLFGTVHVGDKQMEGLPTKVSTALKQSEKIVVEINLEQLSPVEIQQRSAPFMLLPANQSLEQVLKPKTYLQLKKYFANKNIDIGLFERYAPWAVMVSMLQIEYQRLGFSEANGIDKQILVLADENNQPVMELESLEQQLEMFAMLGKYGDDMIRETFEQLTDVDSYFLDLVSAWRNGDLNKLQHYYELSFDDSEYGKLAEKQMIIQRNNAWVATLAPLLKQQSLFIAVGALHLVGEHGLITQLKQQGFDIKKI
ncbi:TraB/GumN family protein [Pseudoalteromonas sp. T1lg65]|uniref:TraB/GumN family protein n=1 Tax=Pseudoalteromonas sp. T1lg65 TaxID=2077101 RepID=UPI003F78E91C